MSDFATTGPHYVKSNGLTMTYAENAWDEESGWLAGSTCSRALAARSRKLAPILRQFDRISALVAWEAGGECCPGMRQGKSGPCGLDAVIRTRAEFLGRAIPGAPRPICESAHISDSKLLDSITVLRRGNRAGGVVISATGKNAAPQHKNLRASFKSRQGRRPG